jgi:hypothetical protein
MFFANSTIKKKIFCHDELPLLIDRNNENKNDYATNKKEQEMNNEITSHYLTFNGEVLQDRHTAHRFAECIQHLRTQIKA